MRQRQRAGEPMCSRWIRLTFREAETVRVLETCRMGLGYSGSDTTEAPCSEWKSSPRDRSSGCALFCRRAGEQALGDRLLRTRLKAVDPVAAPWRARTFAGKAEPRTWPAPWKP